MAKHQYKTRGVCATDIEFELDGDKVKNVRFNGGCNGNLKAVSSLVEGLSVKEIEKKLSGIKCGMRSTSCSDQLALAIVKAYKDENGQV